MPVNTRRSTEGIDRGQKLHTINDLSKNENVVLSQVSEESQVFQKNKGKVKTYVVINIGAKTVPPRNLILGRLRDKVDEELSNSENQAMMDSFEQEIDSLLRHCESKPFKHKRKKYEKSWRRMFKSQRK